MTACCAGGHRISDEYMCSDGKSVVTNMATVHNFVVSHIRNSYLCNELFRVVLMLVENVDLEIYEIGK
jgi:hypothetical protein